MLLPVWEEEVNAAGAFYHFLDNEKVGLIAVEAAGKGIESGESAATSLLERQVLFTEVKHY